MENSGEPWFFFTSKTSQGEKNYKKTEKADKADGEQDMIFEKRPSPPATRDRWEVVP
jgi:hypothetical protein